MATIDEKVDTLESVLRDFIINTNAMFDRIEAAQNKTQIALDKHDKVLDRLEENINKHDKNLDRLEENINKHEITLSRLEENIDKHEITLSKLEENINKHEKTLDRLEENMDKREREMDKFRMEMADFYKEMRDDRRKVNKQLGEMSNKMGTMDEDLISPAVRPVLNKYFNCDPTDKAIRCLRRIGGESFEVDVLAACKDKVFMIEVRSSPRSEYVREILRKATKFKKYFPEHKDKELIAIFASLTFPENVIKYATGKGLYLMAYREWEYMDIINFDEVKAISSV